jgi:hypothetical protein
MLIFIFKNILFVKNLKIQKIDEDIHHVHHCEYNLDS